MKKLSLWTRIKLFFIGYELGVDLSEGKDRSCVVRYKRLNDSIIIEGFDYL